jgi:serine/threonine-protein kinase
MPQPALREDTVPARIGRYVVESLVVSGSFARLFRAQDTSLGRPVAIKLFSLTPERAAEICFDVDEWRRRFVVEARVMAAIDHPHVVRILDCGRHDGEPYAVMPWLPANLRREIGRDHVRPGQSPYERPRPVPPRRAAALLAELASALAVIHAAGLVHRDVKPSNLLATRPEGGSIKLCDFGMVKSAAMPECPGVWFGSRDYLAPEQGRDASLATDRSDVFSVAVLGWRLLLGHLPESPRDRPPPGTPEDFGRLLAEALSFDPAGRPPATEMVRRLAALEWG